jgi:hypothetical protein
MLCLWIEQRLGIDGFGLASGFDRWGRSPKFLLEG